MSSSAGMEATHFPAVKDVSAWEDFFQQIYKGFTSRVTSLGFCADTLSWKKMLFCVGPDSEMCFGSIVIIPELVFFYCRAECSLRELKSV